MTDIKGIETLLQSYPVFAGMDESHLGVIAGCASNARFEAGRRIFREGDQADQFFALRHGNVALEIFVPTRGPVTIETVQEGDVLGWSWLFAPYQWHYDARALTLVRAVAFDGACLRGKCDEDPALGYELMQRFAQVMMQRLQATRLQVLDLYGTGQ